MRPVVLMILVTIAVGLPLLLGRVLAGQDFVNYLIHAQQTAENIRQGVFFPAWSGGYNSGFGSPVLLFFPPVTSYSGALAVLAGIPVALGVGWLALAAHFLSGLAMYGWLRSAGFERSALPAAIVYMVAPYRFVDLYIRSALAEHWAFVWPPLILWIAGSNRLRPSIRVGLTAISVAGLVLTNIPLAVLFGLGLAVWYLVSVDLRGHRLQVAGGAVLAFGLAAFSLVPMARSSSLLDLDACFGPAVTAFLPSSNTLFVDGFSDGGLKLVFSWMVVASFSLVLFAWVLLGRSGRNEVSARLGMVAALGCFVVTTGPAGPIWDATPILSNLQFPWRVTAILTLLAAALVARLPVRRAWGVVVLAVAITVPFAGWDRTMEQAAFLGEKPTGRDLPGTVFPDPHTAWEAGSGGWYWRHHHLVELCLLPKTMPRYIFGEFAGSLHRSYDAIRGRPTVLLESPGVPIRVLEWTQTRRSIEVESPTGGTLMWRVLWFPEMRVTLDGEAWPLEIDPATGLVIHDLPAGAHRVDVRWRAFPSLRWARGLSVASLVLVIGLVVGGWLSRRSKIH